MDLRDAIFGAVLDVVSGDKNTIVLTDDMGALILDKIRNEFPTQVINTGISEQNMMSVAAGLALAGKEVFAYGIASHVTRRCYEQIALDICSMNLPVFILAVGSGLSYGWDGLTHHSLYDLAYMRALPGISIYNPSDPISAGAVVHEAYDSHSPAYIRFDRDQSEPIYGVGKSFSDGLACITEGTQVALIATGITVPKALEVSQFLRKKGISVGVIDLYRIKPLNAKALIRLIRHSELVATIEDHSEIGGIGDVVGTLVANNRLNIPLKTYSLGDQFFLGSANREWVHSKVGLDSSKVATTLARTLSNLHRTRRRR